MASVAELGAALYEAAQEGNVRRLAELLSGKPDQNAIDYRVPVGKLHSLSLRYTVATIVCRCWLMLGLTSAPGAITVMPQSAGLNKAWEQN